MIRDLRVALMGGGFIARKHAESISKYVKNAALVAVCDPNLERANEFARAYDIPAFASLQEMMAGCGDRIDLVSVLTPTGFHPRHVCEVAAYKKHVIIEKPMALTKAEAHMMVDACEEQGVKLFVVKQNRFNKPIQRLRQALDAGRFGKMVMMTARVRWRRDQAYYAKDAWRGTIGLDGGVLANQASHHIDLLQWLGGEVESVYCSTARRLADIESEDTAISLLRFRSGALGVIEATTGVRPKDLEGSISVLGEGGAVEVAGFAANELKTWQFTSPNDDDADTLENHRCNPVDNPLYAHTSYLQAVVETLQGRATAPIDGAEGLKTVAIIEAMYKSSISNMPATVSYLPTQTVDTEAAPSREMLSSLAGMARAVSGSYIQPEPLEARQRRMLDGLSRIARAVSGKFKPFNHPGHDGSQDVARRIPQRNV
jgi:UDP-N-acetyl-2-amino-2-deoxyglucuronate dehydrogenase